MSKMTKAWIEAQIEHELERGNHPDAVRDLAALVTVHTYFCEQEGPEMRQYGRRYDPDRMSAYEAPQKRQEMGHAEGYEDDDHLTREQAEKWVRGMKSEDGKTGARWPYEEIKRYAANFGIQGEEQVVEFFAIMNALYSDYCKVAKKYGVDKTDFWADLAKAFIHDKDAKSGKVKMYYECIAEHDED